MSPCTDRCLEVVLPSGWGSAVLHQATHAEPDGHAHRSYDGLGRQLVWQPRGAGLHACDLEARGASAPALARRFGSDEDDLALRWIVTETLAKLADTPVLAYLRDHGLEQAPGDAAGQVLRYRGGTVEVLVQRVPSEVGDAVVAFGRRV